MDNHRAAYADYIEQARRARQRPKSYAEWAQASGAPATISPHLTPREQAQQGMAIINGALSRWVEERKDEYPDPVSAADALRQAYQGDPEGLREALGLDPSVGPDMRAAMDHHQSGMSHASLGASQAAQMLQSAIRPSRELRAELQRVQQDSAWDERPFESAIERTVKAVYKHDPARFMEFAADTGDPGAVHGAFAMALDADEAQAAAEQKFIEGVSIEDVEAAMAAMTGTDKPEVKRPVQEVTLKKDLEDHSREELGELLTKMTGVEPIRPNTMPTKSSEPGPSATFLID